MIEEMKRIVNYFIYIGMLGILSACSEELEGVDAGTDVPVLDTDCFVVDYTVEGNEGLSRGENTSPITSLTYLLYQDDELVKERQIPDISSETVWPLTRENMTWEQREALKDTLQAWGNYQVVFVANAVYPASGENEDAGISYITGKDSYQTLALQMPAQPFSADNMFYLFSSEIKKEDDTDRDHPLNCPVTLKRVVSCVELQRIQIPEQDAYLKERTGKLYDLLIGDQGAIATSVQEQLNALADAIQAKAGESSESYPDLEDFLKSICDLSITGITDITGNKAFKDECIQALVKEDNDLSSILERQIIPWENTEVSLTFDKATFATGSKISDFTVSGGTDEAPVGYSYELGEDGTLSFIGLGVDPVDPNAIPSWYKLVSIALTTKEETSPTVTISASSTSPLFMQGGKNQKLVYECDPLGEIQLNNVSAGEKVSEEIVYDLSQILTVPETCKELVDQVMTSDPSFGTLDAFKIPLKLPALTDENVKCYATFKLQP
jgi:hypothetical protein